MTTNGLRAAWSDFVSRVLLHSTDSAEERAAFAEYTRATTVRVSSALAYVVLVTELLWWPSDVWLYRDRPGAVEAFAEWRTLAFVITGIFLLLVSRPPFSRHPALCAVVALVSSEAFISWSLGSIAGPEWAPFHAVYLTPVLTQALLLPIGPRIAATLAIMGTVLFSFFGLHPAHLHYSGLGTVLSLSLFAAWMAIVVGHALYHLSHVSFFQARALEDRARELAELSADLSNRVAERTAELRDLRNHLETMREQERASLSRELHDELGQLLAGMRVDLDIASTSTDPVRMQGQLKRLDTLLDQTLEATRAIVQQLRPRVLDDFGLPGAAEWLVIETRRRTGLEISLNVDPHDIEISPGLAIALYRVLQESLTNVVKHADAKRVSIDILRDGEGETRVMVRDDGRGLPAEKTRRPGSFGLLGIRERLTALGGSLELSSPAGGGTHLVARVPAGVS